MLHVSCLSNSVLAFHTQWFYQWWWGCRILYLCNQAEWMNFSFSFGFNTTYRNNIEMTFGKKSFCFIIWRCSSLRFSFLFFFFIFCFGLTFWTSNTTFLLLFRNQQKLNTQFQLFWALNGNECVKHFPLMIFIRFIGFVCRLHTPQVRVNANLILVQFLISISSFFFSFIFFSYFIRKPSFPHMHTRTNTLKTTHGSGGEKYLNTMTRIDQHPRTHRTHWIQWG